MQAGPCEDGSEPPDSTKDRDSLDYLGGYEWSYCCILDCLLTCIYSHATQLRTSHQRGAQIRAYLCNAAAKLSLKPRAVCFVRRIVARLIVTLLVYDELQIVRTKWAYYTRQGNIDGRSQFEVSWRYF
jgi:hypothetical protein